MVKRKYYKRFLTECMGKREGKELCIWGGQTYGKELV